MQRQLNASPRLLQTLLATSLLLLSGCGHAIGNCDFIPLKEYDDGFRERLADEIASSEDEPATVEFIVDAIRLRDAVRACKGEKEG